MLGENEGEVLELLESESLEVYPEKRGKGLNVHSHFGRVRPSPSVERSFLREQILLFGDYLLLTAGHAIVLLERGVEVVLSIEVHREDQKDDGFEDSFDLLELKDHYKSLNSRIK